jgi:hypothetical protein
MEFANMTDIDRVIHEKIGVKMDYYVDKIKQAMQQVANNSISYYNTYDFVGGMYFLNKYDRDIFENIKKTKEFSQAIHNLKNRGDIEYYHKVYLEQIAPETEQKELHSIDIAKLESMRNMNYYDFNKYFIPKYWEVYTLDKKQVTEKLGELHNYDFDKIKQFVQQYKHIGIDAPPRMYANLNLLLLEDCGVTPKQLQEIYQFTEKDRDDLIYELGEDVKYGKGTNIFITAGLIKKIDQLISMNT